MRTDPARPIIALCLTGAAFLVLVALTACGSAAIAPAETPLPFIAPSPSATPPGPYADVTAVTVSGEPGAYQFTVTVSSLDTGCTQYADWWEVLSEDGELLYRRVLQHSHVDEQPFTRSGGPVDVPAETVVIVRAHMSNGGYGGAAMRGSAAGGFAAVGLGAAFAAGVEEVAPLPEGCAF